MSPKEAQAYFEGLARSVSPIFNQAAEDALRDLADRMVPQTPRTAYRRPHMQDEYEVRGRAGRWTLVNTRRYAGFVIEGTSRNRDNPALQHQLDDAELDISLAMDLAARRVLHRP